MILQYFAPAGDDFRHRMMETLKPKYKVKVVIPLYRDTLDPHEKLSVRQNLHVLSRYPVVFVMPEGLAAPAETEGHDILRVSDEWLGSRNGIAGYNRMMMSRDFYAMFDDCEYILICQTDAWIFRDELEAWCDRGYDYAGAPWPKRPIYDFAPIRLWLRLRKALCGRNGRMLRQDCFDRIGNGGLSLRRVESHLAACERYAGRIAEFCSRRHHLYNEDVFWAVVPQEFRYPSVAEALSFSFDVKPDYCYRLKGGGDMPFGCHGWYKKRLREFWKRYLPV